MAAPSSLSLTAEAKAAYHAERARQAFVSAYKPAEEATNLDRLRSLLDMLVCRSPDTVLDEGTPYAWVDGLQFTLRKVSGTGARLEDYNLVLVTTCSQCGQALLCDVACLPELGEILESPARRLHPDHPPLVAAKEGE